MNIYNRLKLVRTERGFSRQKLADEVGVHVQTIGFIERGDYGPSLELAFNIAKILEVNITDIFSDKPFKELIGRKKYE